MKYVFYIGQIISGFFRSFFASSVSHFQFTEKNNPIVIYFSHTGITEKKAMEIQQIYGADLYRIRPVHCYPVVYRDCVAAAGEEIYRGIFPEIKQDCPDLRRYDTILLGYPVWWFQAPLVIFSFLAQHREVLAGKVIVTFCTSGGTKLEGTLAKLQQAVPDAVWKQL